MTQISTAIATIITALQPLQDAGVLVRTIADESNTVGRKETNGVVVVAYGGDREFANTEALGGDQQSKYTSVFSVQGRLRNLRSTDGFYAMRDGLYAKLIGLRADGFTHGARVISFTPDGQIQGRTDTYWGFELLLGWPAMHVACTQHPDLGEDAIADSGLFTELFFGPSQVRDRWDVNVALVEEDG